jgi:hypothetical protein
LSDREERMSEVAVMGDDEDEDEKTGDGDVDGKGFV